MPERIATLHEPRPRSLAILLAFAISDERIATNSRRLYHYIDTIGSGLYAFTMRIRLTPTTPVPPFEQIRAQIALNVAAGRLRPGAKLPTIRDLADILDVAPATVARAYRELINDGVAQAAGRRGTFITEAPPIGHHIAERSNQLQTAADAFARVAAELDAGADESLEAIILAIRRNSGPKERTVDHDTDAGLA